MTKIIYLRQRSYASPFTAPDGEIESGSNITLRPLLSDSINSGTDTGTNNNDTTGNDSETNGNTPDATDADDILSDPNYMTRQLGALASDGLPQVEFALSDGVIDGWHNHPDNPPSANVSAPKNADAEGWKAAATSLLGKLIADTWRQHLFISPFFALSAIRLADGSNIYPSSPVLLIPDTAVPVVEGSDNFALETMKMSIPVKAGKLRCRITLPPVFSPSTALTPSTVFTAATSLSEDELLRQTVAIDLFVSDPINLYDPREPLTAIHRPTNLSSPMSWITTPLSDTEFSARLLSVSSFRRISTISLSKITAGFFDVDFNVPDISGLTLSPSTAEDLTLQSLYTPDFLHHSGIEAAAGCSLSGRITLCDLTLTLPAPPHFNTLVAADNPFTESPADATPMTGEAICEIKVVKNGSSLYSSRKTMASVKESDFPKWLFIPEPDAKSLSIVTHSCTYVIPLRRHPVLNGSFFWCGSLTAASPEDSGVTKLSVTLPAENSRESTDGNATDNTGESTIIRRDTYRIPDAIMRSAKISPFLFPDRLFLRLSVGRIIAICRAFRASGLVATTSPTAYLFTTAGIFLLRETDNGRNDDRNPDSANGELRDAGLIAAYIPDSPESILRLGNTLQFTDIDGRRLCISGTTVKLLSASAATGGDFPNLSDQQKWQVTVTAENPELPVELVTRPLKLFNLLKSDGYSRADNAAELKSVLWDIAAEGSFLREGLSMSLYGSTDLINWKLLARSPSPALRGLFTPGLRFARLKISGLLRGSLEALVLTR